MWTSRKTDRALTSLSRYGKPHRAWLVTGGLATIGVVVCRLAMPWPLRGVVEVAFPDTAASDARFAYLPPHGDPVIWLVASYVIVVISCALFELVQRTRFMTFASWTAHDMRAAAVRATGSRRDPSAPSGDLVARVIGDSARLKAGLSGILVHGIQNSLLFVGVCALLLWISPALGMLFCSAGLLVVFLGVRAAAPVAGIAEKQRRKEGEYAAAIQEGFDGAGLELEREDLNASSSRKEVKVTRLVALQSLLVQTILAVTVGLALWIGVSQVRSGALEPGEIFLFIAYVLTVHRRLVQISRQLTRGGKVMAATNRIVQLIERAPEAAAAGKNEAAPCPNLHEVLRLDGIKSGPSITGKTRIRRMNLDIPSGARVAVVGDIGAGKSSLLRILAGVDLPQSGRVLWDGEVANETLRSRVDYIPQDPVFPPIRLPSIIRCTGLPRERENTLRRLGTWNLINTLARDNSKVSSARLSRNESRLLVMSGILLSRGANLWVLDSPLEGMRSRQARECLEEILIRARNRTVVISMCELIDADRFDHVLSLKRGRVAFYGTLAQWKQRKRPSRKATTKHRSNHGKADRCKR